MNITFLKKTLAISKSIENHLILILYKYSIISIL